VSLGKVPPGPNFGNENYEWNICEISNIYDEIKYHQDMTWKNDDIYNIWEIEQTRFNSG